MSRELSQKFYKRLLTFCKFSRHYYYGVDVAQLGQEILDGKLSVADACKKYNKIAALVEEMVETTYSCEGAHYSSPERHSRLTGAYSGRVYQDRIIN